MELFSSPWRVYPDDAPGLIGRSSPAESTLFIHRMRWQPDGGSNAGDVVHVKNRKGYTIMHHAAVAGETHYEQEYASPISGPLQLESLESGVLEIYIE